MARQSQTLITQVAERLGARIIRNGLEPGDILGTERGLAAQFGVAYGTMRESVNRLRSMGILRGKPRRGLIVQKPVVADLFAYLLPFIALDEREFKELIDFRIAIEFGALQLAIERADEEIFERMQETLEPFETLQSAGKISEADPYDIKFHSLLLEASGNNLLAGLHGVISRYFVKEEEKFPQLRYQSDPNRIGDHRNLLTAIRAKDYANAAKILRIHLPGFSYS
jgi:DNA-binding FadR family transcriptional regulator